MDTKLLAYFYLRFITGVNLFMHGAVRLFGDYRGFSEGVAREFEGTVLPEVLVRLVGWSIPPLEFFIGLSLILGLYTFGGLVLSGLLMATLVFGMSLLQNWGTVGTQMVYVLIFSVLLFAHEYNRYSLDRMVRSEQD